MKIKSVRLTLSLLISAGIITSCSQQAPNLTGAQNSGTTVNQNGSASASLSQSAETQDVMASNQDDESTISDSDIVIQDENSFSVKAENGDGNDLRDLRDNLKDDLKELREALRDRENSLKNRLKNLESQLKLIKKLDDNKLLKLKRKNIEVHTSNVVVIQNADGTTTKNIVISFQSHNQENTREVKISKTFAANGILLRTEYFITQSNNGFTRSYYKVVDHNANGSVTINLRSVTNWKSGKTRTVTEVQNLDANGNGTGNGTVVVVMPNGQTTTFNFSYTITGRIIKPVPHPTPLPTISPVPTPIPTPITLKGFLSGKITIGPFCPVEPCGLTNAQILAFFATHRIQVYDSLRTSVITQFHGDINGDYQIELPVGTYIIDTLHTGIGSTNLPQNVNINAGATTTLNINIDTGIR
jgi:hypothetical protein